jgi:dTDP-glucose 4,6-dehydratase
MSAASEKILVTGGAGFVGSEFVRQAITRGQRVVVVDKITYAGDLKRLSDVRGRYVFYKTDICDLKQLEAIVRRERPTVFAHFAAETHVDRSILDIFPFIRSNIIGTRNCIEAAHRYKIKKFLYISTDEVYGENLKGRRKETAPLAPANPYAATKTCAEHLVRCGIEAYGFPAIIVRPCNIYGPWQYPEKFIPVVISRALKNRRIPIYGKGRQMREWLHVHDCAEAIDLVLQKGKSGEAYNIGSHFESTNLETATQILQLLGKPCGLIQFVQDRSAHDFRYCVDSCKIRKLGWSPQFSFEQGIGQTIDWHVRHLKWLESKLTALEQYRQLSTPHTLRLPCGRK